MNIVNKNILSITPLTINTLIIPYDAINKYNSRSIKILINGFFIIIPRFCIILKNKNLILFYQRFYIDKSKRSKFFKSILFFFAIDYVTQGKNKQ
ncbi:hypothetical protein BVF91_10795 [Thermoanaerobacterium sp. PSU-2]|nr:hypothetical protein BVF91_10795 [Thermoanaerobacterium sp. PSU-2]